LIGASAGAALTSGIGNVAIGYQSLDANQTSDYNTAVGYQSLSAVNGNADGQNTAVGYNAGLLIDSGIGNTTIGNISGNALTSTDYNTFVGHDSGGSAAGCNYSVGIGKSTFGDGVASADGSIAIGREALKKLTTGAGNVAVGYSALSQHTTGARNIAIGYGAMSQTAGDAHDAPDSDDCVFIGYQAGGGDWADDEKCSQNVAIGAYAMDDAMDYCTSNVAIGKGALTSLVGGGTAWDGSLNVCIGFDAGGDITSGYNNVCIGAGAEPSAVTGVNQILIGNNCQGIANNYAVIGDGNITRVYAADDVGATLYAGSATVETSDRRIKEDIKDSSLGLRFVNQLRAVEYKKRQPEDYDDSLKKEMNWYKNGRKPRVLDELDKNKCRTGFIAQEVGEVLSSMSYDDNNDIVEIDESNTQQMIAYSKLVPPMVKAIQELSAKVEELEAKLK
jgi:hypothetical protein